jgi:hypothetical protein
MRLLLEHHGHDVLTAANGQQAIWAAAKRLVAGAAVPGEIRDPRVHVGEVRRINYEAALLSVLDQRCVGQNR